MSSARAGAGKAHRRHELFPLSGSVTLSPTSIRRVTHYAHRAGRPILLTHLVGATALPAQQAPWPFTTPALTSAAAPLIIRSVTVIDVQTGRQSPNRTVVIVGQRIRTITADTARLPRRGRVVDGRGKYLIPGLWDLHVHPQRHVDIAYPLFIANGITGVRDAGSSVPLSTLSQWKREIAAGTRVGPRLLVSGPSINQAPDGQTAVTYNLPFRHNLLVPPVLARRVVDSLKVAGADMIKPYGMSRDMELVIASEARRIGIPFGGHSNNVSGLELSDSGATFLDHEPWLSPNVCSDSAINAAPERCRAVAEHLRRNNTWITSMYPIPTDNILEFDSMTALELPMRVARFWPAAFSWSVLQRSVLLDSLRRQPVPLWNPAWDAALRHIAPHPHPWIRAGLPLVLGSDPMIHPMSQFQFLSGGPGFSAHVVLAKLVADGMTPREALQAATLNPALALRATDSLGTVEAGKVADLVLLDADPLQAIWNTTKIRAVIANGRYYDRAALDRLVVQAESAAATTRLLPTDTATTVP